MFLTERRRRNIGELYAVDGITEADADAPRKSLEYDPGKAKPNTVGNHLADLRWAAARSDTPLVELAVDEAVELRESFHAGTHPEPKDDGIIAINYVSAYGSSTGTTTTGTSSTG